MKPPNFLFHFNNDFPHEKLNQTTYRGITVNHFRSCQEWPEVKASLQIDYYFTVPGYNPAVSFFSEVFKELPVSSVVKGYIDINEVNQTKREINHEYNFFEFRPIVQRKSELFNVCILIFLIFYIIFYSKLPRGIYCEGQLYKEQIPSVPESYSYITETINIKAKIATSERVFYSNFLKTFRLDLVNGLNIDGVNVQEPIKIIHDYNSGVAYVVNKNRGNCTFYPLGSIQLDNLDEAHLSSGFYTLKKPDEFLKIDDTYVYAGERYERGLLCDVFVSKRNDIVESLEFITELYLLRTQIYADQSTDKLEKVVPISYHITGQNFTLISHAFDFDSQLNVKDFDVSQCFQGKRRINFGIQFGYPGGVDEESFTKFYGRLLEEEFDLKIFKSFKFFSASPLRIARPRFEPRRRGFTVYSAITDHADSI
ncbi:EF-hand domain-containing D1, partial [Brachionus plicatilis]